MPQSSQTNWSISRFAGRLAALDSFGDEELSQEGSPFGFKRQKLVADRAFLIVEFEETGGYGAASGEAGAARPAEPVVDERALGTR